MTNDELERAVERLTRAIVRASGAALVDHDDLCAILSERAELLAAVERMRGAADTHPPQPDALPGDLRERVAQIIEAAIERHNPGNSLRHTLDEADAILSLIQSERGRA